VYPCGPDKSENDVGRFQDSCEKEDEKRRLPRSNVVYVSFIRSEAGRARQAFLVKELRKTHRWPVRFRLSHTYFEAKISSKNTLICFHERRAAGSL